MRVIAFAPMYDTPGRHDATGAFQPEAKRFIAHWKPKCQDASVVLVDNHASADKMRERVVAGLRSYPPVATLGTAFFCHGYRLGIQLGFNKKTCGQLVRAIRDATYQDAPTVTFYSCDVARDPDGDRADDKEPIGGDGGFCDLVRDGLCEAGKAWCTVDGHTTVGHTTRNPYVRRFEGHGERIGGTGGFYIVSPGSKWWSNWRKLLRGNLRFDYPYMTVAEIQAIVRHG